MAQQAKALTELWCYHPSLDCVVGGKDGNPTSSQVSSSEVCCSLTEARVLCLNKKGRIDS